MKRLLAFCFLFFVVYTINGNVNLAWDPIPIPTMTMCDGTTQPASNFSMRYEVQLIREVTGEIFSYATSTPTLQVRPPKSGHYNVKVRGAIYNKDNTQLLDCSQKPVVSPWCDSLNSACSKLQNGTPGDWKAYWKPAAPGIPFKKGE